MTDRPTDEQLEWFHHRPGCEAPTVVLTIGRRDGDPCLLCRTCRAFRPVPPHLRDEPQQDPKYAAKVAAALAPIAAAGTTSPPEPPEPPRGRYQLECVRCERVIHLPSQRPRVPLCDDCRPTRQTRRKKKEATDA